MVKKIFKRVMSGTKDAAKAVQGHVVMIIDFLYWSMVNPDDKNIVSFITCRQIQGVQEDDEIAISRSRAVPLNKTKLFWPS